MVRILSTKSYDSIKQFNITVNSKPLYISTLPLNLGMTNSDVVALQNALIKLEYNVSSATGYFGSQTKSAIIAFQTSAGMPASGTMGTWTYSALNYALITKSEIKNLSF
ncbi:peptidoglycan-binding protein [Clostridium sp. 001]|uniref:peptidoglycan-binding domain-containing protein n=1 Tax=Clostridium sp. 001 TaxID=1970093 RepID=UPI0020B6FC97|nr:peptidoglycan-binding domain-containing protein [Clostridium sp. 001]